MNESYAVLTYYIRVLRLLYMCHVSYEWVVCLMCLTCHVCHISHSFIKDMSHVSEEIHDSWVVCFMYLAPMCVGGWCRLLWLHLFWMSRVSYEFHVCHVHGSRHPHTQLGLSRIFGYSSFDKGMCAFLDCLSALQGLLCVAVCCSVLQCVAVCCSINVSQCVTVCCSVLHCQRVAVCCRVLQFNLCFPWLSLCPAKVSCV